MKGDGTGRVLLYRSDGSLISRLICWQTRSIYCHMALLYPDDETVIESVQFHGVQKRPFNADDAQRADVFRVQGMSAEQWQTAMRFAEDELGCGYDYRSILRFITRTDAPSDKLWFCSELGFAALLTAGVELLARIFSWAVSPGDAALSTRLIHEPRS